MFKRIFFCLCVIISSHNTVCSTGPLKNRVLKAALHGAKTGGTTAFLFTVPTMLWSNDSPKERLLLPILSGIAGGFGGVTLGGISAFLPGSDIKDARYWRAGCAGYIAGTLVGVSALALFYFKDLTLFNP